jgi:hypothetical protein
MMHLICFFSIVWYFDNLLLMSVGNAVQDHLKQIEQDDVSKLLAMGMSVWSSRNISSRVERRSLFLKYNFSRVTNTYYKKIIVNSS